VRIECLKYFKPHHTITHRNYSNVTFVHVLKILLNISANVGGQLCGSHFYQFMLIFLWKLK